MSVEEVHIGARKVEIDPKNPKEKGPGDPEYWEQQKKEERAKREFLEEKEMIDRLKNPPAPEAPFQIKGSVNLGNIDVQEAGRKLEAAAIADREASQTRINALTEEANKAKEALHNAELQRVNVELTAKIDALKDTIKSGDRKSIVEELTEIDGLAGKLGYIKPQAGPSNGDPALLIELKRLEVQMAKDDRDFKRQMAKDSREWDLKLMELNQNKAIAEANLASERDKWKTLSDAPKNLGAAIAKGLLQEGQKPGVQAQGNKPVTISANKGEAGELDCPTCGTVVAIGPTARGAVCANCRAQFTIKRNSATAPSAPPAPPVNPEEVEVEGD